MTNDIQITKTARLRASQGLRSVASRQTVEPRQAQTLRELAAFLQHPAVDIDLVVQTVRPILAAYEAANPFHADHGDVPLGLRRVIRLLTGEQAR